MNLFGFLKGFMPPRTDLPGALISGQVINRFPLLQGIQQLIGLDPRQLTTDRLQPSEIGIFKAMDGTSYSGLAHVHKNYIVHVESGKDINDREYWVIDIFARNVDIAFMQQLCENLVEVYGTPFVSHGAGKYTSKDYIEALEKESISLKCWQNLKLEGYSLKTCQLWLRMHGNGTIANLHYHVFES